MQIQATLLTGWEAKASGLEGRNSTLRVGQTAYMYSKDPKHMTVTQQANTYRDMWMDMHEMAKKLDATPQNEETKEMGIKTMDEIMTSFEE